MTITTDYNFSCCKTLVPLPQTTACAPFFFTLFIASHFSRIFAKIGEFSSNFNIFQRLKYSSPIRSQILVDTCNYWLTIVDLKLKKSFFPPRWTCELCQYSTCYCHGWITCSWEDIHFQKIGTLPELDWNYYSWWVNEFVHIWPQNDYSPIHQKK